MVPKLLALSEVAECCRVSPHTVRKWVREGKLRPVRLCRRLLFDPNDVTRFIRGQWKGDNNPDFGLDPILRDGEQGGVEQEVRDAK